MFLNLSPRKGLEKMRRVAAEKCIKDFGVILSAPDYDKKNTFVQL